MDPSYRRTITRDASIYHATVVQDLVKEPNKNGLLNPTSSITLPKTRLCYPPNPTLLPPWRRPPCTQPPKKSTPPTPSQSPLTPRLVSPPPSWPLPPKECTLSNAVLVATAPLVPRDGKRTLVAPSLWDAWAKLRVFLLVKGYERLVSLDAGALVLRGVDELFRLPLAGRELDPREPCMCR